MKNWKRTLKVGKKDRKRVPVIVQITAMMVMLSSLLVPAQASTIGGAVQNVWDTYIMPDFKTVAGVVLAAAAAICLIVLVITAATAGISYRQNRGDEIPWKRMILLGAGVVVATTASLWMWGIIGA